MYRIMRRMKVTAIIDDQLIRETKELKQSSTTTEAIAKALKEWRDTRRIKSLNAQIAKDPIVIASGDAVRTLNRERNDRLVAVAAQEPRRSGRWIKSYNPLCQTD
jgi:predicted nucleic acid-binding protein